MKKPILTKIIFHAGTTLILAAGLWQIGCSKNEGTGSGSSGGGREAKTVIQVQGSDTMVNLTQAWAEQYGKLKSDVSIEVGGGGSGVGIAALINGTIHIASASRDMQTGEKEKAKSNSGKEAKEFTVGFDALAVFVHKDNPLNEITLDQLKEIFAEGGSITKWSQLGVNNPGCDKDTMVRISRQSSSGTFAFFREHVLDNDDFKQGSVDMNGSKEVVETVTHTPCSIGYSGMGYATHEVKMLKIAKTKGAPSYEPNLENTLAKTYPIARPLFLYTLGEPTGATKEFIDWTLSAEGQKIVENTGYVPVAAK